MGVIDPITQALQAAVQRDVFPGAVLLARVDGMIGYHQAVGFASRLPTPTFTDLDTLYDLASLTKPLATGTAILCLIQDNSIHLDQSVGSLIEEVAERPIGRATVRDLLCHRSGLPAWRPYFESDFLWKCKTDIF